MNITKKKKGRVEKGGRKRRRKEKTGGMRKGKGAGRKQVWKEGRKGENWKNWVQGKNALSHHSCST